MKVIRGSAQSSERSAFGSRDARSDAPLRAVPRSTFSTSFKASLGAMANSPHSCAMSAASTAHPGETPWVPRKP